MVSRGGPDGDGSRRLVKRYANRKLYDTHERRFTSLSHIRSLVRDGVEVLVVDHDSGEDLTAETLSQALGRRRRRDHDTEDDRDELPGLGLLSELIRAPARLARAIADDERDSGEIRQLREQVQALSATLDGLLERSLPPAHPADPGSPDDPPAPASPPRAGSPPGPAAPPRPDDPTPDRTEP